MGKEYEGLKKYAMDLATDPPVESYRAFQDPEDKTKYIKKVESLGSKPQNYTGTVCDVTAYALMVSAAGIDRIEAMKKSVIAGQTYEKQTASDTYDRASAFTSEELPLLRKWLDSWWQKPGNGVVQFKFDASSGAHTFMIERVDTGAYKDSPGRSRRFRVYQSYEGKYRLADFLRISNDKFLPENFASAWDKTKAAYWKLKYGGAPFDYTKLPQPLQDTRGAVVNASLAALDDTSRNIGRYADLTWQALDAWVITPLYYMLAGKLPEKDYRFLSGTKPTGPQHADYMIALLCDVVDPNAFASNYQTFRAPAKNMSGFVTSPLAARIITRRKR